MIRELLKKLSRDRPEDESELVEKVRAEQVRLVETKRRANRVLADFYRADAVIRGKVRSGNGA
jgi:hypothetical protein